MSGDILLVGATGLVGSAVAAQADAPLTILARRPLADDATRHRVIIADSAAWPDRIAALRPAAILIGLGTTIRQAGSKAQFRAVDHDLVLAVASAARTAGAGHAILISSVGADPAAGNFYLRTKGEVERGLQRLAFTRLDILRPGLLMGRRTGPARPAEALAMVAAPLTDALLHGRLRRYRSIPAITVARAMLALAAADGTGSHVHEHDAIVALAD